MSPRFLFCLGVLIAGAIAAPASSPQQQQPLSAAARRGELFGGAATWGDDATWLAVTDRVRGGASTAALDTHAAAHAGAAVFAGVLDTAALGGAGFASVRAELSAARRDLAAFAGIAVAADCADGRTYALNLHNSLGARRPDGRRESAVEFKFSFETTPGAAAVFYAPFSAFVPYYRGRPVTDGSATLDPSNIVSMSIMIQSYFDKQKGPYELVLHSISAY
ncbi:CIA30 family protein [Obelidium mucronatum]|nr:CIA30 family protein [Obelidium mucronatum]